MKLSKKEIEQLKDGIKVEGSNQADDVESDTDDDILTAKYPGSSKASGDSKKETEDKK